MTEKQKGILIAAGMFVLICLGAMALIGLVHKEEARKKQVQMTTVAQKSPEYEGLVMGYPITVGSNGGADGWICYTVYVYQLGRVVLLDSRCPQLRDGEHVIIGNSYVVGLNEVVFYRYIRKAV